MTDPSDRFTWGRNEVIITPVQSDAMRAQSFMEPFGLGAQGGVLLDKGGHPLSITPRWTQGLEHYAADELRRAGQAIAEPDEIRSLWTRGPDGSRLPTRRYLATIDGVDVAADLNRAGWAFATSEDGGFYLDELRVGDRIWPPFTAQARSGG